MLPPLANAADNQQAVAYNAAIPDLVGTRAASGAKVSYVDMYGALTLADLADGTHPNASGYSKLAQVWYAGLTPVLPAPPPGPTAPSNLAAVYAGAGKAKYVDLSWIGSADTTAYRLQRATNASLTANLVETTLPGGLGTYRDSRVLAKRTTYYYRVIAVSGESQSAPSNTATVRTQ
jgi:hypothetical protein